VLNALMLNPQLDNFQGPESPGNDPLSPGIATPLILTTIPKIRGKDGIPGD